MSRAVVNVSPLSEDTKPITTVVNAIDEGFFYADQVGIGKSGLYLKLKNSAFPVGIMETARSYGDGACIIGYRPVKRVDIQYGF